MTNTIFMTVTAEIECVDDPRKASALLDPLRLRILKQLSLPASATDVAGRLGLPRQKVNYHARKLAEAGFLQSAGRRRKRNMTEQRWVATARSYLLSPEVVAPVRPDLQRIADKGSAAYLLAAAARIQSEVGVVLGEAEAAGQRVATLTLDAEIGFTGPEQRAAFTRALEEAVAGVLREHTVATEERGARPFRLTLACHPMPARESIEEPTSDHASAEEETP